MLVAAAAVAAGCGGSSHAPECPKGAALPVPAPSAATAPSPAIAASPTADEAQAFLAEVEENLRRLWVARDRADWVNQNFLNDDTAALDSAGEEATAAYMRETIQRAKRFDSIRAQLPPDAARKLYLLSFAQPVPAPSDPSKRAELAAISVAMKGAFGTGQYCPPKDSPLLRYAKKDDKGREPAAPCLRIDELRDVFAKSRNFAELVEAWRGWHAIGAPMKDEYARYVELANAGAREIGYDDVGALWRSGYDMSAADFEADVERLWADVKPLYEQLHCYARAKLQAVYGKAKVPDHAPIPAQLLGDMWAQEWTHVYELLEPFRGEPSLDVGKKLERDHWDPKRIVRQAEHFFTALGFDPLPQTFWERSLFVRPRDREVVCHASAWDPTWSGDLRIKMCIEPTDEDFVTIHHELGHDFYFQRYFKLPILFQNGANDGFHEAIGDTIALSVTPEYLKSVHLLDAVPSGDHARINHQMKMALDKVAFLPFGLLIDKWRWDVFAGKVGPGDYNAAWWKLREQIQGVAPPVTRTAADFDPGAKYHVATSTPYVRYFLARIYQFQFHKALCQAAGFSGPLDQCSIHDNRAAGAKLMAMLALGQSRPWPDALEAIGAGRKADAGPMLEYFAPLREWLADQNKRQQCGW
jgi:peptidyl-dipeptidase A